MYPKGYIVWLINSFLYNDVQSMLTQFADFVFTLKFLFIIIYWRGRTSLCARAVPASFPRFVSFSDPRRPRSICTSYTPEFQLYKRWALPYRYDVMQSRVCTALSATINTSIYVFGIALAIYLQHLIFMG